MTTRHIVAMGGGGFSEEPDNRLLDDYIVSLSKTNRPRICFIPTASGDSDSYIVRFYEAFSSHEYEPSHLSLSKRDRMPDIRKHVLNQDIIYVGGGNTVNLLACWRAHGLDQILREAWDKGVILSGISAGAICWFEAGITDSFGLQMAGLPGALGFLSGSFCPHFDGQPQRQSVFRDLVSNGFPGGYAADEGVALHYRDQSLVYTVSSRKDARAYKLENLDGKLHETILTPHLLTADTVEFPEPVVSQ